MASIIGFRKQQRADKGFDFFDPTGRKITIEQYTSNTGVNRNNLVRELAGAGDRVSQEAIKRPTFNQNLGIKQPSVQPVQRPQAPDLLQLEQNKLKDIPKVFTPQGQMDWKKKNTPLTYQREGAASPEVKKKQTLNDLNRRVNGQNTFDTNLDLYGNTSVNKEIQRYNNAGVYDQRSTLQRLDNDFRGLEGKFDDTSARKQAQISLIRQALEAGGQKKSGSLVTGVQDFVGGVQDTFKGTGDRLARMTDAAVGGTSNQAKQYNDESTAIYDRYIQGRKKGLIQENDQRWGSELARADELRRQAQRAEAFQSENADPLKAAGAVANAVALPVSFAAGAGTTGAAAKLGLTNNLTRAGISDVATQAVTKYAPNISPNVARATGLAIENVIAGAPTASTEVMMNAGSQATAQDYLTAQGMNALMGAALPLGGAAAGAGVRQIGNISAPLVNRVAEVTPQMLEGAKAALQGFEPGAINFGAIDDSINRAVTRNHPEILELRDRVQFLRETDEAMAQRGLSPNNPARINNLKAQQDTLKELQSTANRISQGGYIRIPGNDTTGNQAGALPESSTNNRQSPQTNSPRELSQEFENQPSSKVSSDESIPDVESQYFSEQTSKFNNEKQFVNDIVERIWEQNKKGSGVDTWLSEVGPGEGTGYNGRGALSNNSRFYSDYYKEFGKKPTKRDIADMVHQALDDNHKGDVKNILTEQEISHLDPSVYAELKNRNQRLEASVELKPNGADDAFVPRRKQQQQSPKLQEKQGSQAAKKVLVEKSNRQNQSDQPSGTTVKTPVDSRTPAENIRSSTKDNTSNVNIKEYVDSQVNAQKVETKTSLKMHIRDYLDEAKHSFVDDAVAYERYVKDKDTRIGLREGVDRVRSSDMIARQFAEDNGMKEIGKLSRDDLNQFQQYLIAKRSQELERKGIETGRDIASDEALIKHIGDKFKKQETLVRDYSNKMLDYSVDSGLISKELADNLKAENPNYIPMNRVMDSVESHGVHKSKQLGSLSKQSVVQKIKGSELTVDNPIESLLKNTSRMVNEAERNNVAKALTSTEAFSENILADGQKVRAGFDTVSLLKDGKKVQYEVPELVAEEMKNLNGVLPDWASTTLAVLGAPTRMLRAGATSANPIFAATNMVRDQIQTLVTGNSKAGIAGNLVNNIRGSQKAFLAAFAPGKTAASLREGLSRNGIIGNEYRQTYGYKSGELMKELQRSTSITKTELNRLKNPINALADVIGRTEYFTRAQQFYGTKGDVVTRSQAARNNTLNFSRAGTVTRTLNKIIPFLNAGVQGGRITVNKFRTQPIATSVSVATLTGVALAVKAFAEADEDRKALYDRIGSEEKKNNLVILSPDAKYNPDTNRVEGVIKIPMPQMTYPFLDAVNNIKGEGGDISRLVGDIIAATTGIDVTNPISQLTPTFAKPFAEASLNKSFYTGNDLVSEYEKNKKPEDKGAKYSSGVARGISKATGIDAPVVDNLIGSWGGGLAKDAAKGLSDNPDNAKDGGGVLGSLNEGWGRRFGSAGITSQYDIQSNKAAEYKKSLKDSTAFKSMGAEEQAKLLDKVDADTKAIAGIAAKTEQNKSEEIKKDLTKRQQNIVENGFNVDEYIKQSKEKSTGIKISSKLGASYKDTLSRYEEMDTEEREDWFKKENDAQYSYESAKYENDKANGSISDIEDISRKKTLRKSSIGQDYSKDVRDLYSLSKDDIASFLATSKDGEALKNQLIAYDRALYDSGVSSSIKFKLGQIASSKGGGGRSKTLSSYISLAGDLNSKLASNAKAKTSDAPSVKKQTQNKTQLKKYAVTSSGKVKQQKITTNKNKIA